MKHTWAAVAAEIEHMERVRLREHMLRRRQQTDTLAIAMAIACSLVLLATLGLMVGR